jgi:hypothetical protein
VAGNDESGPIDGIGASEAKQATSPKQKVTGPSGSSTAQKQQPFTEGQTAGRPASLARDVDLLKTEKAVLAGELQRERELRSKHQAVIILVFA